MMAAGRAAELGRSVLLLEKNPILGKKLLTTGGGRCNVTNNKQHIRVMVAQYKGCDQFLMSAFAQFDVTRTLQFFHRRGMRTKEELEGRMFPFSNVSQSVLDVLVRYMDEGGVTIRTGAAVCGFALDEKKEHVVIQLQGGEALTARACIVATGGVSHPETGSTGEGFRWLASLGHTIAKNNFALVPIALADGWVKKLAGVTLEGIKLTTFQDGKKQDARNGRLLFTHFGISGPTVLNMSKDVGELLREGDVMIALDLFPKVDIGTLRGRLQAILISESNKKLKNALVGFIPSALVPALLEITKIDGEIFCHSVRHDDRIKLVDTAKAIPLHVKSLLGANKAIVSSGGVALTEVNFKTMQSRIVPQLYLVGDVLNINRPSGGYSLQLCWTTGYVAGSNIVS